ncbi:hypothetical protein F511_17656 [Dorcoceras hygrometricum]|uniref:Uncharacterized protein n=1 Tax=Dorcoceras hygrometricum TaxID=472368 RepID=A0A2Z7AIM1_9LAMI|nr:hypothetical protein F511_17656 [Dorcoceras hygrometricum]
MFQPLWLDFVVEMSPSSNGCPLSCIRMQGLRLSCHRSSPAHSTPAVSSLEKQDVVMMFVDKSTGHDTYMSRVNSRIQRARDFAVAEAQQDGCMASFRIFDSAYGNYLVPVIPTRAELGG